MSNVMGPATVQPPDSDPDTGDSRLDEASRQETFGVDRGPGGHQAYGPINHDMYGHGASTHNGEDLDHGPDDVDRMSGFGHVS
jgi:hypothetical protein